MPNVCFLLLGGKGHALLILRPEELGFLRYLREAKVPLNEFEFSWSKVSDIQPQLEKLISKNYFLNLSAKEAFKGYARAYESHSLKQVNDNSARPLDTRPLGALTLQIHGSELGPKKLEIRGFYADFFVDFG